MRSAADTVLGKGQLALGELGANPMADYTDDQKEYEINMLRTTGMPDEHVQRHINYALRITVLNTEHLAFLVGKRDNTGMQFRKVLHLNI